MKAYAARTLNDRAVADDVAQDVMLRLWSNAGSFDPGRAKFSTWLYQIAYHRCIDELRRRSRLSEWRPDEEEPVAAEGDNRKDALAAALGRLPERQRSALVLTYYQGLANREVASMMGISVRALESLLVRARKALREVIEEGECSRNV